MKGRNCFLSFLFLPVVSWLSEKLWEVACAHLHLGGWARNERAWSQSGGFGIILFVQFLIFHLHTSHQPPRNQQLQHALLVSFWCVWNDRLSLLQGFPGGQTGHHKRMQAPATLRKRLHLMEMDTGECSGTPSSKFSSQTCLLNKNDFFFLSSEITSQMLTDKAKFLI